jgi:uncharacterized cupin superfamily protein
MKIYNVDALPHSELISSATGEAFSKSALLSELFAHQDIFVHHEILPPGRRSSSPHRHTLREEMIFVLKGCLTAHLGDQTFQLKPGDFIGFNPASEHLHFIENATTEDACFLVICSNPTHDRVIYEQDLQRDISNLVISKQTNT